MNVRRIVQQVFPGLVLGAEAVGAIVLHESHSLLLTAVIAVAFILFTVWLFESGLDLVVRNFDWAANLFGTKLGSKATVHGFWYSQVRDKAGVLLGGSVFRVQAGIDGFKLTGDYLDLTTGEWGWWSGDGSPFEQSVLLYGYRGVENHREDEGFGRYSFAGVQVTGEFYGKHLSAGSKYRTVTGARCPAEHVTPKFKKDVDERQRCLESYLPST